MATSSSRASASLKQKARRALNRAKPLIGRKPTKPSWVPPEVIDISVAGLHVLPLFDPDAYLELNPTLKGKVTKPYNHAIARASKGPFTMFEPQAVARVLAKEAFEPDLVTAETTPISGTEASSLPPIGIYASSYGNVFMREIAEDLAHDFRLLGADVEVLDETADIEARRPVTIVVAPHEFFFFHEGRNWTTPEFVQSTFIYNTEQLQTKWFERSLPWILASRGLMDICLQAATALGESGLPAMHLEPSLRLNNDWLLPGDWEKQVVQDLPLETAAPGTIVSWNDRPLDLSFFGTTSERRDVLMAQYLPRFEGYRDFINYVARIGASTNEMDTRVAGYVATQSKISLNIHRDDFPYFEWHRIVKQGMGSGALVVTDECLPHPLYKPGVHFFSAPSSDLPDLIDWLLRDPAGQQAAEEVLANVELLASSGVGLQRTKAAVEFITANS